MTMTRDTYEASELNGHCPKCDSRNLYVLNEEYTKDEDHELIRSTVHCNACGKEFDVFND